MGPLDNLEELEELEECGLEGTESVVCRIFAYGALFPRPSGRPLQPLH